jgi:hypothetical protein
LNCKNCHSPLEENINFCSICGARIVKERITSRLLVNMFLSNYIGWDTSFTLTLRTLLFAPVKVISDYLNGVRKRYMAPIVFVSFGVAIATIVYNVYSEEYMEKVQSLNNAQFEVVQQRYDEGNMSEKQYQYQIENLESANEMQGVLLKNFNIVSFALLPLFALISLLVFGRKFNYGEHLVINCYLQGLSFFVGILFFMGSIFVWSPLFYVQALFIIPFYLWTYSKLQSFGLGKALLKFLLFIAILLGLLLVVVIVGVIIGITGGFLMK